jgi:hypothetical protein
MCNDPRYHRNSATGVQPVSKVRDEGSSRLSHADAVACGTCKHAVPLLQSIYYRVSQVGVLSLNKDDVENYKSGA